MSEDYFEQMFSGFESEAFRLECLSEYKIYEGEYAAFQAYIDGQPLPTGSPDMQDWHDSLRSWTADRKRIIRLRVLPIQRTPYLNFELEWGYPFNIAAGEEIFLIEEDVFVREFGSPAFDFWLFDQKHLLKMNYSPEGEYVGADLLAPDKLRMDVRINALRIATPFREFLKMHRQQPLPRVG